MNVKTFAVGRGAIALTDAGACWGWGRNEYGCIGNNAANSYMSSPVATVGSHVFSSVAFTWLNGAFLKADGTLWTTGGNDHGQTGLGYIGGGQGYVSSPALVVGNHSFIKATCGGAHMHALKANGQIWGWGLNYIGQLGDGTITKYGSPVAVIGNHSFVDIADGWSGPASDHAGGLKANGEIWMWGAGAGGALGDGTIADKSSPVAVIGAHSFVQFDIGHTSNGALKADGSAWFWGTNNVGQLGDGSLTNRSSPVAVIGGHSFKKVAVGSEGGHSFGLKANGELWAWGYNSVGQLGDGTVTTRSSPVLVVGNHSFVDVEAGAMTAHALKANGELWGWGNAGTSYGVGDGTAAGAYSSPVLVIGGFTWMTPAVAWYVASVGGVPIATIANANNMGIDAITSINSIPLRVT